MADDANPACREWLGIEPGDLALPHLLLGVAAGESDPLAIVRAADRRLALLRTVATDRTVERDALLAQVEAARDAMLAAAVEGRAASRPAPPPVPSGSGLMPPPPPVPAAVVPPPVPAPPPVPPAADPDGEDALAAGDVHVSRVRFIRRRRADHGAAALGIASLAIVAATVAVYVAWPHLQNPRHVARTHGHEGTKAPTPASTAGPKPDTARAPKPAPKERPAPPTPDPQPAPRPAPEPRPAQPPPRPTPAPQPSAEPPPMPMTEGEPAQPAVDVEKVRAAVSAAVAKGYESLRNLDFAAAKQHLEAVADEALDDQQATDRLQRWRQLLLYAEQYPRYRDEALASAATTTATFDCGKFQIGVVEFTARDFIYRDSRRPGRNLRVSRDAIPSDVEQGLVEQWFAKDGRAANHLFLGAAALSRREPDLAVARREWRTAADGGEPHGELLLGILEDPVVRGR